MILALHLKNPVQFGSMIELLGQPIRTLHQRRSRIFMNVALKGLKSRLKGTWVHHAVWSYKNPPTKDQTQIMIGRPFK
jgi:hypothetical protein